MKILLRLIIFSFLSFSLIYFGCNNSTINEPPNSNMEVSFTSSKDTVDKSANTLTLDTVKILIKDIKLNSVSGDTLSYTIGSSVVSLNLNNVLNSLGPAHFAAATYSGFKFEVHQLQPNETVPDPEFKDSLGNYYSVVAKGFFNGSRFVYKSTNSSLLFLNILPDITFNDSYRGNVTVFVKPLMWFRKNGDFMDPRDPQNFNDIDNNIKNNVNQSFRAFKDNDKNGIPDN